MGLKRPARQLAVGVVAPPASPSVAGVFAVSMLLGQLVLYYVMMLVDLLCGTADHYELVTSNDPIDGADFDLYLYKWNGFTWAVVVPVVVQEHQLAGAQGALQRIPAGQEGRAGRPALHIRRDNSLRSGIIGMKPCGRSLPRFGC